MPGLYYPKALWTARAAAARYLRGVMPYHQELAKTTLPKRYPAGDLRNYERVATVALALRRKKLEK